jgi:hypothetical protein
MRYWGPGTREDSSQYHESPRANFVQTEAGVETLSDGGLLFRATVGTAFMLNPGSVSCVEEGGGGLGLPCGYASSEQHVANEWIPTLDLVLGARW